MMHNDDDVSKDTVTILVLLEDITNYSPTQIIGLMSSPKVMIHAYKGLSVTSLRSQRFIKREVFLFKQAFIHFEEESRFNRFC